MKIYQSYYSIRVDDEMSTNDSIYVLANGAASNGFTIDKENDRYAYEIFKSELTDFGTDLQVAKSVVRDGEGATKFMTVTVKVILISLFDRH